jgi:phosphoenolpyruvate carboxylase
MNSQSNQLAVFDQEVAVRQSLYSSLFTTLPFAELESVGSQLPVFAAEARQRLDQGDSPVVIIEDFLQRFPKEKHLSVLFRFLQLVERHVVLFDAIEDAAFEELNNLVGPGTLEPLLDRIEEKNLGDSLYEWLQNYRVRIVLTAHPTQFYPESVLGVIRELSEAIAKDDLAEIRLLLLQLGRTKFRNREKPTPLMEARSVLGYLENNFYHVLPDIQRRATRLFPEELRKELPALLEIGFWPGGDRDGNPFVTSQVTRQVGRELKSSVLGLYLQDARKLLKRLTFDGVYECLVAVIHRLECTLEASLADTPVPECYALPQNLIDDLENVQALIREKHRGLFAEKLEDLIDKVRLFGFHFAILDLRQDSRIHEQAILDLLPHLANAGLLNVREAESYRNASEIDQLSVLLNILSKPAPKKLLEEIELPEGLTKETLWSYRAVREIQDRNGKQAIHRSIISNTQAAIDLFEVLVLAHASGWDLRDLDLDVVPLFETIEDLHNSFEIMSFLYQHPVYRAHLERRGMAQHIMVGFSDGTKDGGYLGANYGIYQAKRDLTRISRENGIKVTFFDGRGGPPARGGGNTHRFYRSMGKDVEHDQIHLTIQGQTISSNFGTLVSARYNMEQMFTAGIESFLFHRQEGVLDPKDADLLNNLSDIARDKYLVLKNSELFVPYLEEMTPLRYYDRLNVGSRPTKRKSGQQLKLEDLRAIPFVGSWSQIKQNIPGFYGLGTALQSIREDETKWNQIKALYKSSLFFQTLMDNAMQALSKTFFPLTAYLQKDARFGSLWQDIHTEATLTKEMLKDVAGIQVLLEREPVIRASIRLREKTVLPLLVVQQYALDRVREAEEGRLNLPETEVEALRKLVVKSLAANINASRNSA